MTFSLSLSSSDLLLLLPEIFLTCWLCVVLITDFSFPRLPKENLAYLSVAGLLVTLGCLGWFDVAGISGTLFSNMFVVDASFFPSSAAVNPGMTIAAQALRAADHIIENDL